MVNTSIYCDRCGANILEGRSLLESKAGPILATRSTIDLCRDCASAFRGWLAGPPSDDRSSLVRKGPVSAKINERLDEAGMGS